MESVECAMSESLINQGHIKAKELKKKRKKIAIKDKNIQLRKK